MKHLSAFVAGALFATGLAISGMVKPAKVIGFLDFTGAWGPTLAFVMGGALLVFAPGYRWATRRARPLVTEQFDLPQQTQITGQLVAGAAIFGLGWGVSGMCPGVAIASVPLLTPSTLAVTGGIALGIIGMRLAREHGAS
jgi:uncharacterized membrane protein YedE/YeeE